jgi:branched-chain amino acid aminotransferase
MSEPAVEAQKPAAGRAFPLAYHDGRWGPLEDAVVPVGSLAMRYALSVFEGIRLYVQEGGGVAPLALDDHLRRLEGSLRLTELPDPGIERVGALVSELVELNRIEEDAYVRLAVSAVNPGQIASPARTCLTLTATPMGRKRWLEEGRAMRVEISFWQRQPAEAFPTEAKCIAVYAGPRIATLQAQRRGYDQPVLTNAQGLLCEAPTAALFLAAGGRLWTPRLGDGALPSITRAIVLELCRRLGIEAAEGPVTRAMAYACDEAFLCGTALEIGPVASFDDHPVRAGAPGPLTRRIVQAYFQAARRIREGVGVGI